MQIGELQTVVNESTRPLEREIASDSRNPNSRFDEDLQLRCVNCGLATAALQRYLIDKYDIQTDRLIATPPKAPRGVNSRRMSHVILRHEGYMIDPTYSQFLTYVGLDATSVSDSDSLRAFYPVSKIAVIDADNPSSFINELAEHAYAIAPDIKKLSTDGPKPVVPSRALIDASLGEIRDLFTDIWDINGYTAYPIENQEDMQNAATRIADRMLNC